MSDPKAVYIAGPMTGRPNFNYPAFHAAANRLRRAGCIPRSSAHNMDGTELTPPTTEEAGEWGDYLRHSIRILTTCDQIHMLDGWTHSRGARIERALAYWLGIPQVDADGQPAEQETTHAYLV